MKSENALSELRQSIRECLSKDVKRNVSAVADDESLLEAGAIDSLGVLQLVAKLEERYGISVSDDDLLPENFDSIHAIAAFVAAKRDALPS
jgi:acyl carrier protein